jgi:NurA domain
MLDLSKLAGQMQSISQHLSQEAIAQRKRLERAQTLLEDAQTRQDELVALHQKWRDRIGFVAAEPVEPLSTRLQLPVPPAAHTVLATDGSQIAPNHHEIAYCYLINIGRVMLHYGQSLHPLLDSLPEVFYRPEDLYESRKWGIRTEEWMGYRRTVSEAEALADLSEYATAQQTPLFNSTLPSLAMVDGSLIYWFLDGLPNEARDRILPPILAAWKRLRAARVPLMGYLSASRSSESLNFLRLPACPYAEPNCYTHCPHDLSASDAPTPDRTPCQVFEPLRDTILWSSLLQPGERGPLWRSSSPILHWYDTPNRVYFCHVNVGSEIARIDMPAWVAEDRALCDSALSLMLAQVQKGYGYPVTLAEAHNQAVVRGGDRSRFFGLLEQQMIKAGLRNVGTSYKEARKRGSIA